MHNSKELKRRPVRANDRINIGIDLQNQLPRAMYLTQMATLNEEVMLSGCRDVAPIPHVLRNISLEERKKSREHRNEFLSLQIMLSKKTDALDEVLQKVILHPKGILLWSKKGIAVFNEQCREDIVYLDATGSIKKKRRGPLLFMFMSLS